MDYDFTTCPSRADTGSLKWQKYAGRDVLPCWVADMDFVSPPEVVAALRARVEHGVFGYTVPHAEVEDAVLGYLHRTYDWNPARHELLWLPGLVPALNVASRAFGGPGRPILTCTPVYPPFLTCPEHQERELRRCDLVWVGNRWTFDREALERLAPGCGAFILCNPHNPVGRVFDREELTWLGEFCARHDLVLISDEIHCDLILEPGLRHLPTATLSPELAERTVTLMAPSKTYNLAGLACSFAVISNPRLRTAFQRAARGFITEVNALGYTACAAAYRDGEPWRQALLNVLRANRDAVYACLARHPQVIVRPMEATYLAWLDVRALQLPQPAAHFEAHGLGLSDGIPFGAPGHVRLNFGCPPALLAQALTRLERALVAAQVTK